MEVDVDAAQYNDQNAYGPQSQYYTNTTNPNNVPPNIGRGRSGESQDHIKSTPQNDSRNKEEDPGPINDFQDKDDKPSKEEEGKVLEFLERSSSKDKGTSKHNPKSPFVNERSSDRLTAKRVLRTGRVKTVIPDKKFGFISPVKENNPAAAGSKDHETAGEKDIYFRFDSVRGYLFSLKINDIVQYYIMQGKNNKISAVNVTLLKPVPRRCDELSVYLDLVNFTLSNDSTENVSVIAAKIVGSPNIWYHLSEMISISKNKMNNEIVFKFLRVIRTLEQTAKSLDEGFKRLLESIVTPSFFNPFRGKLKIAIKATTAAEHFELIQNFLLTIAKHVPDKVQSVISLIKPMVDKDLPGSSSFLYSLLKTISYATSGNVNEMDWNLLPLILTNDEVHSLLMTDDLNLRPVNRTGAYESPDEYMETYFRLLRTDCFFSLKQGIKDYLCGELDNRDMKVYVNVIICGIEIRNDGLNVALKVKPTQKVRDWDTCRHLMFGNLLCLSVGGNFKNLIWATVTDRSLLKSDDIVMVQSCDEFNIAGVGEMIADMIGTGSPIVMAESPTYYRAFQPVLKALQAIQPSELSFMDELVFLKQQEPFQLFRASETIDPSLVYKSKIKLKQTLSLQDFIDTEYDENSSTFDRSQEDAVKEALSHNIGIIQGPPGSGKSFIGVTMLRILLSMESVKNAKILILTYKNHALDEFTKDVLKYFPTKVVRIGGGSRDEELEKISLKNVKREGKKYYDFMDAKNSLYEEIEALRGGIENDFDILNQTSSISHDDIMSSLSPDQKFSLIKFCDWKKCKVPSFGILTNVNDGFTQQGKGKRRKKPNITLEEVNIILKDISQYGDKLEDLIKLLFKIWIPVDQVFPNVEAKLTGNNSAIVKRKVQELNDLDKDTVNDHFKDDGDFIDKEELRELENERIAALSSFGDKHSKEKRNIHTIKVTSKAKDRISLFSKIAFKQLLNEGCQSLIHCDNLWDLDPEERVLLIQYHALRQRETNFTEFETKIKQYEGKINQLAEINNTITSRQLDKKQIFAMTITGASIHHSLLAEIRPEILIVEEAAEILEPQLVAAMGSWTKYMLLIGDHYQLRPSVETYELKKRFNFDISMMERLIKNNMNHSTLQMQNRQRPEMAKLLSDIYPTLKTNEERVANNFKAECLSKSSFFWNHNFLETKERSVTNRKEGERAVMLALFLIQQGYSPEKITILATYQGQTSLIRKCLKEKTREHLKHLEVSGEENVKVHTVDMYQGDENDFVIISLVRSNTNNTIGFLNERSRRCVAQSRARCGVYFIGNSSMFLNNVTWKPLMENLKNDDRIGNEIQIMCRYHPDNTHKVSEFTLKSFCKNTCSFMMDCQTHACIKMCQPKHNHMKCEVQVHFKHIICGHKDIRKCYQKQDTMKCHQEIKFNFTKCGHTSSRKCHEKEDDNICNFQLPIKLSCGHINSKKCSQNDSDIKCEEKCMIRRKCGHLCKDHKCHEHAKTKICVVCEKIIRVKAQKQKDAEEKIRIENTKAIEEEISRIRASSTIKVNEAVYEELFPEGSAATEYLDVEDHVKKYVQPTHRWFPRVTKIFKVCDCHW